MIRLSQRLMTMIDDGRKGNNMGLSTGISKLDSLIYGVQRKWMYVVGAASGGGLKKSRSNREIIGIIREQYRGKAIHRKSRDKSRNYERFWIIVQRRR